MSLYRLDLPAYLQLLSADSARVADRTQPPATTDCTVSTANTDERRSIGGLPSVALLHLAPRMR